MRILHLSDLHIGKRVNEFSMIEDQRYIFDQIYKIIEEKKPDAVLIAGDIYDKSIPSEEAVELCDEFITTLSKYNTKICIISGNHDSAERLSFGSKLLKKSNIYISSVFDGNIDSLVIDGNGDKDMEIFMLPFIKPSSVRRFYPDKNIVTYDDSVKAVVEEIKTDKSKINVLMLHQFITGFKACESEDISVGTLDQVNVENFKSFDYVALGHIHGPQNIKLVNDDGKEIPVRYCGTPLKYSFSEMNHHKSVTLVDFKCENNEIQALLSFCELTPLHELREIKGTYEKLTSRDYYKDTNVGDYIHVILTDEEDVPDALARMRSIYPNIMKFDYDNTRTRKNNEILDVSDVEMKTPQELFSELYEIQNNKELSEEQKKFLDELVENIWK